MKNKEINNEIMRIIFLLLFEKSLSLVKNKEKSIDNIRIIFLLFFEKILKSFESMNIAGYIILKSCPYYLVQ